MVLKATTAQTVTINLPAETTLDSGKITHLVIKTPVNGRRVTGAEIHWAMGNVLPDGKFDVLLTEQIEIDATELYIAMSQLVVVGENVGAAVERVIWDYLISIGRVPAGAMEV